MDTYTLKEIMSQGNASEKTYQIVSNMNIPNDNVEVDYVFTGCGTSYYIAISAARYFQEITGIQANAVPASEIFLHEKQVFTPHKRYRVVSISRSGTTSEIITALKAIKARENISTLAVTCNSDAEMAQLADDQISLDHISEKSVVMTQSFTNMLYAIQLYAARFAENNEALKELKQVPELLNENVSHAHVMKDIVQGAKAERFIFLGAGIYNGLAKEGTLKLKEMTQTECESYSNLEFRHGPISIVDEETVVVLFSTTKMSEIDHTLLHDIKNNGGKTIVIGDLGTDLTADHVINIGSNLSDEARAALYIPYFQLLAYYQSIKLGLNPDQPRNLNQVVKISLP
ncbi:SIS domain-containing protein [Pseudalkalibacillus sp. NRS-1564]|uniref:SIS domain-containing protein n=1 Tax=Pseudalkalibacillus sp. NRS-1564 TaxID=3233900 RepID=UPI003D2CA49C